MDPDRIERFEREARAASALNHPNIVTIHDVGVAEGTSYIAMEWVDGSALRDLVARGKPQPIPTVVSIGAQRAGSHRHLALENLALRHQLAVYKKTRRRPKLRPSDQLFWVCLSRM